jgi:Lon protease-like protein
MRNTLTVVPVPSPSLPLFPLGTVLLPGSPLPLRIFEPRYRQLVADLLELPAAQRGFGVVAIREGHEVGSDSVRALYDVGCLALVTNIDESADGTFEVSSVGTTRFRVTSLDRERLYLRAAVDWLPEDVGDAANLPAAVSYRYAEYHATLGTLYGRPVPVPELPRDARQLSYLVAAAVVAALPDRQGFLEVPTTAGRLDALLRWLRRETALLRKLSAVPATGQFAAPACPN